VDLVPRVKEDNPDPRIACALLLDTSGSMSGEPIEQLNDGFERFCTEIKKDDLAKKRAEVAVITFGAAARVEIPFTEARDLQPHRFTASGATPLGGALNLALDLLSVQKQAYQLAGLDYYRPWLFVLTDGEPTDGTTFTAAADRLRTIEQARGVSVFPVGVGPHANLQTLRTLSDQRVPVLLRGLNFGEFFSWLSSSLAAASASNAFGGTDAGVAQAEAVEQIPLPPAGWARACRTVWKVVGASVTGRSHAALGIDGQDASAWLVEPAVTCLVVADGAGSRPRSARGARLAVDRVLRRAVELAAAPADADPAGWLSVVFTDVHECLARSADEDGRGVADYASTLAVALLTGDSIGVGQVGDTIAVVGAASRYRTLAPAPRFEYVNETVFVTDPDVRGHLRLTVTPADDVDAVFLSTDGLRLKILDHPAAAVPFAPFFDDVAAFARAPEASSEAVHRFLTTVDDQSGDDKTLVVAVRCDPSPVRHATDPG
jgi:uncharacterized protein YegL